MNNYNKLSIKDWAVEDRPREKLIKKGISALSNAELIAILLGSGTRNDTAVELAKKVLARSKNNLHELGRLQVTDLMKHKGIGEAKAISIIAALELGRRRKISDVMNKEQITSSKDVALVFQALLGDLQFEEFWVLFLNRANKVLSKFKVSQGGVSGTVIDVRLIIKHGIELLASAMIICHNHPSGNLRPSTADTEITRKLKEAGKLMDISLLDHIIIGDNAYYSFADEGVL